MAEHLFVYGTLKPGEPNARELDGIDGAWQAASVRGAYYASGRGPAKGYPGVVLDGQGDKVPGMLFTSEDLPGHWNRLDEFEGEGYRRVETGVLLETGETVGAWIYELRDVPE